MFDFRRITLFCLEKRLLKHKMTIFSQNLRGHGPFAPPGYDYGFNTSGMCVKNNTSIYVARTSRNKKSTTWISIVACCHSVKLCTLAARPFQSQQSGALTGIWRWCQVQPSQKERAIGVVHGKNRGCFCNFSVGVPLKVWFLHAPYPIGCMQMTRDEHGLGFKSFDISIYWRIWMLSFLLKQIWIGIDYFLLNFFATFGSILGLQITATLGSVLGLKVTVGLQVNDGLQSTTRWESFVTGTMLRWPEPNKERVEPTVLSIIVIDIRHLTRFALLLLLRILRYMWRNHVATWACGNNSGRNLDVNKIRFSHLRYILQYSFLVWIWIWKT